MFQEIFYLLQKASSAQHSYLQEVHFVLIFYLLQIASPTQHSYLQEVFPPANKNLLQITLPSQEELFAGGSLCFDSYLQEC